MRIAYTDEQEALRRELREYYAELLDPDTERQLSTGRGIGPGMRRVVKQMAADGWLGIGWPKEYGGQGRGPIEQFIFFDESMRAGAPVPMLTINTVGPTIMKYGTEEQKDFFLPKILRRRDPLLHRLHRARRGHRPRALRTTRGRATATSTSSTARRSSPACASDADYCWLAVRTDPEVKKHQGISIIIVPMDTPGLQGPHPIDLIGEHDISRVSTRTCGSRRRTSSAARTTAGRSSPTSSTTSGSRSAARAWSTARLAEVRDWAQSTKLADGRRVIDQEWVQLNLARAHAGFEFLRLMNWKVAWHAERGRARRRRRAARSRCSAPSTTSRRSGCCMEVLGAAGLPQATTRPGAVLAVAARAACTAASIILTFGGGTNEIQRDLIAVFGLGMPMAQR